MGWGFVGDVFNTVKDTAVSVAKTVVNPTAMVAEEVLTLGGTLDPALDIFKDLPELGSRTASMANTMMTESSSTNVGGLEANRTMNMFTGESTWRARESFDQFREGDQAYRSGTPEELGVQIEARRALAQSGADFRKNTYDEYRQKYLQGSQTTLGDSKYRTSGSSGGSTVLGGGSGQTVLG